MTPATIGRAMLLALPTWWTWREFMQILGGSLFQVFVPIICGIAFARRNDRCVGAS
jgi:hypothetical protein